MFNTRRLEKKFRRIRPQAVDEFGTGKGGAPYSGNMEARVGKLETAMPEIRDRLTKIETRLDLMPTFADLHREINLQTWRFLSWMTGVSTMLVTAVYFIARNVH